MSLPPAAPTRQLKHRRPMDVPLLARDNGLRKVDGAPMNAHSRLAQAEGSPRPAGAPTAAQRRGGVLVPAAARPGRQLRFLTPTTIPDPREEAT